ncbi:MAG: ABC transporter ATP-binding protein [Rhodobacteraceae bacterium]|nr:ABC transporter ATP-binding protein [Paracoccaceae bacterium]
MAKVTLCDVSKNFDGVPALSEVSATIKDGEFVALLGPSGCGKTTLLRLIAGFEAPCEGEILVDEGTVASARTNTLVPPEARNMGIVFQSYALWPHMSVLRNIAYPLEVGGMARAQREAKVAAALQMTGLTKYADRMPAALSGGQRQRVALARCLVADPTAVLLDEPLANLDLALRGAMRDAFAAFHQRTGATMIYVTHDQTEAMAMADRVAVIVEGRIVQFAPPETLYNEPANSFVAGFVGDGAVVDVNAGDRIGPTAVQVTFMGQPVTARSHTDRPNRLCIRPEDLTVSDQGVLRAKVRQCTYLGGRFRLSLKTGHGADLVVFSAKRVDVDSTLGLTIATPWAFTQEAAHG